MLNVLFERGPDPPAGVRRQRGPCLRRGRRRSRPSCAEQRQRGARRRHPADHARVRRSATAPRRTAGWGVSTHGFGSVCQWAIQCLNLLTGNFDRVGGVLFPEPAVDTVGRRIVGRGHYDVWKSRVRGIPEYGGELPVSTFREEIETPGEGQIRAVLTIAGNPVLSTPDGKRLGRGVRRARLHGRGRHLPQRDDPPRRRDPADRRPRWSATTTTWSSTAWPCATPPGSHPRCSRGTAGPATTGRSSVTCPRGCSGGSTASRRWRSGCAQRARLAVSPTRQLQLLLATGRKVSWRELRRHPEGVDLGPLRPTMPERLQTKDQRIDLAPALLVGDLDRLRATLAETATADGRAAADRPPAQAGQQLLDAQHRAADPRPGAPPAADAPRRPRRPRHRRRRAGHVSRRGSARSWSRSQAADDMMPGVVSLPHGYGHQVDGTRMRNASKVPGVSINDLTDPERLDVSGNAALNGVPVHVEASERGRLLLATGQLVRRLGLDALPRPPGRPAATATRSARRAAPGSPAASPAGSAVASSRIAADRPTPIIFISIIDSVAKIANTDTMTAAALVTTPAVSLTPRSTASRVGSPLGDVLTDPAEHEHVVVHRQADQDHHHEQRDPVDDEARAGEVERPGERAVLEHQRHDPERRTHRGEVEHRRDERDRHAAEREPHHQHRQQQHHADHDRQPVPLLVHEVEGLRGAAADGVLGVEVVERLPAPGRRAGPRSPGRPARRTRRTAWRAGAPTCGRPRTP